MRISPLRWAPLLATALGLGVVAAWIVRGPTKDSPPAAPPPAQPMALPIGRLAVAPLPSAAPRPEEPTDEGASWVELNNAATDDLLVGDLAAAAEKLQRCHAAVPDNAVFCTNLAEVCVRLARSEHEEGRLAEAIAQLERGLALGRDRTDREALEHLLERWRRERELGGDDWTDGSSRFELTFDTDRGDILHRSHEVLEHLERSFDELVAWFGLDPFAPGAIVRVLLYDPEDFDRLTGLGDWAAGVFDGAVRVSVRDLAAGTGWRSVLVHELVHAFIHAQAGRAVPGWLNEGLAQLLEGPGMDLERSRELLRGRDPFPLESLAGSLASWSDPQAIQRAYAQSLLFVSHLRSTFGDEALRRMLAGIRAGEDSGVAFEDWSRVSLATAFEDWCASL